MGLVTRHYCTTIRSDDIFRRDSFPIGSINHDNLIYTSKPAEFVNVTGAININPPIAIEKTIVIHYTMRKSTQFGVFLSALVVDDDSNAVVNAAFDCGCTGNTSSCPGARVALIGYAEHRIGTYCIDAKSDARRTV